MTRLSFAAAGLALGASALLQFAAPAMAADLPSRAAPPPPAPAPVFATPAFVSWAGPYVGVQVGYGRVTDAWTSNGLATLRPDGFLGGIHSGYNWDVAGFLVGVEGDVEYGKARSTAILSASTYKSTMGAHSSARLRAGYAIDRALVYVTGGLAGAPQEQSLASPGVVTLTAGRRIGWTAGAGVEYALNPHWSARAEYRYSDFGAKAAAWSGTSARSALTEHSLRLGLSHRLGDAAGPIIARY